MAEKGKADGAYDAIERMIIFQEITPGSLVSESMLTASTGFGRTPVREALQRLAREGMVQIHPSKGVLVPAASVDTQLRLLELRRVLESLAVGLACDRALHEHRKNMAAMVDRLKKEQFTLGSYLETVKETHHLIVGAAANEYLADALAPAQALSRRFWIAHMRDEEHQISLGSALHSKILEAILARDESAAKAASQALNDYLVDFAYAVLGHQRPLRNKDSSAA
ncbi:GntR family transcriptional regulator [Pseudarthrobacter sp. NBSH8]|uniref:GntR family transcriptional regulator n=1 Tax=Pseudarthrobacter sp. NBSH8 TaxID=2596911 RepID=UPI001626A82C|nr:GntR family transcriptional regulator [Pseudarthrobacter sp. NBSH8]QNE13077.1 GntR family transcriptional regulator [Pseudarthrobacter sp. NBSH8]